MIILTDEMKKDFRECARLFTNLTYLSSMSEDQAIGIKEILELQRLKIERKLIKQQTEIIKD